MSEDKSSMTSADLDALLASLEAESTRSGPVSESEIDREVAAILQQNPDAGDIFHPSSANPAEPAVRPARPASAGESQLFRPVPPSELNGSAGENALRPHLDQQPNPADSLQVPLRPARPRPRPSVSPASEPRAASPVSARPSASASAPAEAEKRRLLEDGNPLVNDDFRRFFTTSVTPNALFSSVETAEEPAAPAPAAPSKTESGAGFFGRLHRFFTVQEEEEPEDAAAPEAREPLKEAQTPASPKLESRPAAAAPGMATGQTDASGSSPAAHFSPTAASPAAGLDQLEGILKQEETQKGIEEPSSDGMRQAADQLFDRADSKAAGPSVGNETASEDDYTSPAQREEVAGTLDDMVRSLTVRTAVLGALAFVALYLSFAGLYPSLPKPGGLYSSRLGGLLFLGVQLVLLLAAMLFSLRPLTSGVRGLWGAPSADSYAALASLGALVHTLTLLGHGFSFDPAKQLTLSAFAILCLFTNTFGNRMLVCGVRRNFQRLADSKDFSVASLVRDEELTRRLARGLGEPRPDLMVSRPTAFYEGFLHESFSTRRNDRNAQRVCWGILASAVVAAVVAAVRGGSVFTALAGVLCLACPLSMTLSAAVPNFFMNRSAERAGTVLPGAASLEDLGQTNIVLVPAARLFPKGTVRLHGIKTFSGQRIDLAILYVGSVLTRACPTLSGVFLDIIQNRRELLYDVEHLEVEPGLGFDAWLDSKHILVGGRAMMESHQVTVPSEEYEHKYTKDGKYNPIYLAVNGELFGLFVVNYHPDAAVQREMDNMYESGLSLLVTGEDFNLTGERISGIYRIPDGCIKVLDAAETQELSPRLAFAESAPGAMVHESSFDSFIAGIRIAASGAAMEKVACLVQTAAAAVTVLLVLAMVFTGGLSGLTFSAVVLYQLAWTVLTLALPAAKQY